MLTICKTELRFVAASERKIWGVSFNKAFSLQFDSFASVVVVNVERRKGPKSCDDCSRQTDCWNRDLSVVGKRPNPTLSFQGIKFLV